MNWWNRFLSWLGVSEPGNRKEQVEDWIAAHEADIVALRARIAGSRGFHSKLAGEAWYTRISAAERAFGTVIPTWADVEVDVFEAPTSHSPKATRMGYRLVFQVKELNGSKWRLTLEPGMDTEGWKEVPDVSIR